MNIKHLYDNDIFLFLFKLLFLLIVPGTFFNKVPPASENSILLGCYCLEVNENCREILWFLTLDGRFSVKANIEVIYREAITVFQRRFVESFDELIDQILYPIFITKFSKKHEFLRSNSVNRYREIETLDTKRKCLLDGSNCYVALNGINGLLNKFFRKFSVLNKEFDPRVSSITFGAERRYGTLLANLNFLLDENQFKGNQPNVELLQIRTDLTNLLQAVIPSQNISLSEFIGLLGYGYDEDENVLPHMQGCCKMIDQMFDRRNIEKIMTLMKYTFGPSVPWLPQHFSSFEDKDMRTAELAKDMRRIGLDHADNESQKRVLQDNDLDYLQGWRFEFTH